VLFLLLSFFDDLRVPLFLFLFLFLTLLLFFLFFAPFLPTFLLFFLFFDFFPLFFFILFFLPFVFFLAPFSFFASLLTKCPELSIVCAGFRAISFPSLSSSSLPASGTKTPVTASTIVKTTKVVWATILY